MASLAILDTLKTVPTTVHYYKNLPFLMANFTSFHCKVFDQFICLLVKKSKSFKYKIFNFWGWKVRPNATNCTWRENNSYLFPLKSPAQPCQLPVGYVPLLFVIWTFIGISILLFILIPYSLKTPPIQANCAKPWVLRNTHWGFVKSFGLDCFIVFSPPHSEFQNTIRIQPL